MLYVNVQRGVTVNAGTKIDHNVLNQLGQPVVQITGTIDGSGSVALSPGSVTTNHLASSTNTTTGVTNAKLAFMPTLTVKGNDTGADAAPQDLTVSEARSMLSVEADDDTLEHYDDGGTGKIRVADDSISTVKLEGRAVTSPKLDFVPTAITGDTEINVQSGLTWNVESATTPTITCNWIGDDDGKTVLFRVKQMGTSNSVNWVHWDDSANQALTTRWKGSSAPTYTTTTGAVDLVVFTRFGSSVYGSAVQSFDG